MDLNRVFRFDLVVLDAVRILTGNGPQGGRLQAVRAVGKVIAGTDPVAVDSFGATLFGISGRDVPHVLLASQRGRDLLKKQPKTINVKLLKQYPEFLEFQKLKGKRSGDKVPDSKKTSDFQQRRHRRHWKLRMKISVMNQQMNYSPG